MERTPEIIFGGDTDVAELMNRISSYTEKSRRNIFINGVLFCRNDWMPQEVFIPGNLKVNGICNNKIILRTNGNLECRRSIDIGILKVEGDVFCEDSIQVFDLTVKGGVHCDGVLGGQFVIVGKDLLVTKESHPAINVNSLSVNGNIYCNGSMQGDRLLAEGDVYCKDYMDIPNRKIKGEIFIEKTQLCMAK